MSQEDILEYLRDHPRKWCSVKELKESLRSKGLGNGTINAIYNDLYKLVAYGDIKYKGVGILVHKKLFKLKIKN